MSDKPVISGATAFYLHSTKGLPLEILQLWADEHGYTVDVAGYERLREAHRAQSKAAAKRGTLHDPTCTLRKDDV